MNTTVKICILCLLLSSQVWPAKEIRIDGDKFEFGLVPNNSTMVHRIWIHADGRDTLRLADVKTGCGCVTAPWSADTILPGDSLSLVFYWQTRGSVGPQSLSAYLFLEPHEFPLEINMSGNVVTPNDSQASVSWQPAIVQLSAEPDGDLSGRFTLKGSMLDSLKVRVVESGSQVVLNLPDTIEAGRSVVGQVVVEKGATAASYEGSITLELSGNQTETYRVSIPVQYGDFSFRPLFTTKQK
jgi:hypothetical protein